MNQTRKHRFARALATFMAGGLLLVGYACGAALFNPAPSEIPLSTSLTDAPETGTTVFVLQGRDGNLVPLSPAASIAKSYGDQRPTETETVSLTDQILAGVDAPLIVRARSRYSGPATAPVDSPPLSGMVPTLALIGLSLWFALHFAHSSHPIHGHQTKDTPRGFFNPRRKLH
jgi:hypothetical protein